MLRLVCLGVAELDECFACVFWNGEGNLAIFVVPGEVYSAKELPLPVHGALVVFLEFRLKVLGLLEAHRHDTGDEAPDVLPQAWSELTLVIPRFGELFYKKFVGKDSSL